MKRTAFVALVAVVAASCNPASDAGTCREYAAEVGELIRETSTAGEIQDFLNATESHVAELILAERNSPDAELCAEAVLEATFTAADREFSEQFEN
ncbi:MAG: hypothetical protein KJO17_08925 [Acidimicrobiia bacterium]|nr:hypothetical protein [Acidimicrobiia bacterium]MBT8216958.1 hypothetical protein [Acidimicrobiia bacterium]NNL71273.1 hypothetical protein [Acidimicrobiia bacterium]